MIFSPAKDRLSSRSPAKGSDERKSMSVRSIFDKFSQEPRRSIREPKKLVLPVDEQQILNINCMNCQELVPLIQIEEHSKTCTSIPESVQSVESESYPAQVMFKLKKLESCLSELEKSPELRPGDKNYVKIFLRYCRNVIEATSAEQTEQVIKQLSPLLVSFKGTLSIRVYADRLQTLVQEQKLGLQEIEIDKKRQELEKIREEVEKYKHRSEVLQKSIIRNTPVVRVSDVNRRLDEISSDIGSLYSGSSGLTVVSSVEEEKQDLEEPLPSSSNDLRTHFYSLCLTLKMKQNKPQNISIQKLYNEAVKNGIQPDAWSEFINCELRNPAKWLEDSRGRRRNQPKMKPQYFEVIVEEEQNNWG